ncbi:MAG: hypothetical protein WD708_07955 [Kiritimatiellia bacterium]
MIHPLFLRKLLLLFCLTQLLHADENLFRTWTSADGQTAEARMKDASHDRVTIINRSGKEFTLPLERFSDQDRDWVSAERLRRFLPKVDDFIRPHVKANPNGILFLRFELFSMGRREWRELQALGIPSDDQQDLRIDGAASRKVMERIGQSPGIRSMGTLDWLALNGIGYPASAQTIGDYQIQPNLTGFLQPGTPEAAPGSTHIAGITMGLQLRTQAGNEISSITRNGSYMRIGDSLFVPLTTPANGNEHYLLLIKLDGIVRPANRGTQPLAPRQMR